MFTKKNLESVVTSCNKALEDAGVPKRFVSQGRNGYQAVDEYPVNESGERIGSHIDRTVGTGTSREVAGYTRERMYELLANHWERKAKQ